jgi:hypothetical protein
MWSRKTRFDFYWPKPERLPWGEVELVLEVWATWETSRREWPPPRYSGRWRRESGETTPNWALIISIAVLNKEIYYNADSDDDKVFGYQERHAEYRYKSSSIHGKLRSSVSGSQFVCLFVGKLTKIENVGQRFYKIATSVPCVILYIWTWTLVISVPHLRLLLQPFRYHIFATFLVASCCSDSR